jgi:hypothetical protein
MMGGVHWNGGPGNNTILNDFWSYNPATDTWTQKNNLPFGALGGAISYSINDRIYFGIGLDQNQVQQNIWWMYDPASDTWTQKADFAGGARLHGVAFRSKERFFFGLGITQNSLLCSDLWVYYATSNTWVQKADFPGGGLYDAASFYLGDNGYIVGGYSTTIKKEVWEYSYGNDNWSLIGDFTPGFRRDNMGISVGNVGYCGFGVSNLTSYNNDLWEFYISVGVPESNSEPNEISVYPNPALDVLSVESKSICKIEIFDVEGKIIVSENYLNLNIVRLPLLNIVKGLYYIKIITETGIKTSRFMKY